MNIFSYWDVHNSSKEYFWKKKNSNFMHRFKSAILEKLKNCQNGKVPFRKNIHKIPQGPPNPGFMQEKVQKEDFLKKPS